MSEIVVDGRLAAELGTDPEELRKAPLRVEDVVLAIGLTAMMLLPISEMVLRRLFSSGVSNETSIVQHLTLVTAMLGAAIAARERRLVRLGSLEHLFPARWLPIGHVFSAAVAAAICAALTYAGAQFVLSERASSLSVLAYGIPVWIAELAIPIGFAVIGWRVVKASGETWSRRSITAAIAIVLLLLARFLPVNPEHMLWPAFIVLLAATLFGLPVFAVLAGAGLILFWTSASPLASISIDHYTMATNATIPTVPLFTMAGCFLAAGGASRRLVRLFRALVGDIRGGPAILVAVLCAFFTSFTGASGVTILALGGLLMPVLMGAGYTEDDALGLVTGTGSLGMLFPPCLPLIFYGVIAGVDMNRMFLGGILPGTVLVILTAVWGVMQAPRVSVHTERPHGELWAALKEAKWELLLPVIALGALFGGLATPVEAAALTAAYAFFVETIIYRDLTIVRDGVRTMSEAGVLKGGMLLILAVALGFTNYLAFAEVPTHAAAWIGTAVHSRAAFLLYLNLFLLCVGMLMDVYSAIIIVVPLILPMGKLFDVDPVHLGIIFLANLELGYLAPPLGQNLFLSSLRFNKPVAQVMRATVPMMVVFLIGVIIITYIPVLTTALPALLH